MPDELTPHQQFLTDHKDEIIDYDTKCKFNALTQVWTKPDAHYQITHLDDALQDIKPDEWKHVHMKLVDLNPAGAGLVLQAALMRICRRRAEEDFEESFERGD